MTRNCFFLCFLFIALPTYSGGPLAVSNGEAAKWRLDDPPITYRLDQGNLGPLSNFRADYVVNNAFRKWNRVTNSILRFEQSSHSLPYDVTSRNYERVIAPLPEDANPIIYDDDGRIVELKMGVGSRQHILGFATTYSRGRDIVGSEVIFNGYFFERQNMGEEHILSTILHEIGHLCGLDHTQHSRHLANNNINTDDHYVSTMYPTSTDNDELRQELSFDDQISIANLYPNLYHTNSTGTIRGVVKRGSREMPGVNVIARDINDPFNRITTTVTGTYELNRGTYEIRGLPPGNYEVMIEAIDPRFNDASSVGQYADYSGDLSFRSPPKPMYYHQGEGGRSTASPVKVKQFNTTTGIDFQVDNDSLPLDEETVRMLAVNSQAKNGAAAGYYSSFPFLLHPAGDEGQIVISIEFDSHVSYVIDVEREQSDGTKDTHTIRDTGDQEEITLGGRDDLPLEKTRYFIAIGNTGSRNFTYTVRVDAIESANTPTNTPEPTSPPTHTPTPREAIQPRPTLPTPKPYPTRTPTPTTTPTPTPTPQGPLKGDINGDELVDTQDAFIVLEMTVDLPIDSSNVLTLEEMRMAADVNGDGKIMANDAILILQIMKNP